MLGEFQNDLEHLSYRTPFIPTVLTEMAIVPHNNNSHRSINGISEESYCLSSQNYSK